MDAPAISLFKNRIALAGVFKHKRPAMPARNMRTNVEFTSDAFPPYPGEDEKVNPGIWGQRLAEFIVSRLPEYGVETGNFYPEDWGWEIPVKNEAFPIFIGCGNKTEPGGTRFLCFIDPSTPETRTGLFKKVSTLADVDRVADALDEVLQSHPAIKDLRWLANDEI